MTSDSRDSKKTHSPTVVTEHSGSSREMLKLAFPQIISFVSLSVMGVVDTLVIGQVGTGQQAGVGLGAGMFWGIMSFFTGTLSGVTTFVAQANGAGRTDELRRWVMVGLVLVLPMTVLCLSVIPLIDNLIVLFQTSKEVRPHVVTYLSVLLFEAPFMFIMFVLVSYLRGLGDTVTPMIVTLVANVINAALDIVLVFGFLGFPALGVTGAALASIVGMCAAALMLAWVYFGRHHNARYNTRRLTWVTLEEVRRFMKTSTPIGASWAFENVAWNIMTIYIGTMGAVTLAGHIIVWQLISFSFMPTVAISVAASTLVGQYLGAQRPDLARKSARVSILWGLVLMGSIGVFFALGRGHIIAWFNDDPAVMTIGGWLLLIAAAFQLFDALGITIDGVLRGAGDTRFPLLARAIAGFGFFIPLIFVLGGPVGWGVYGAWSAGLVFVVLLGVVMLWRYRQGSWLHRTVLEDEG